MGPYQHFELNSFSEEIQLALQEGAAQAHDAIEARGNALRQIVDGWQEIPPMGNYGTDYIFRSAVAWKFIYTNSLEEALYPIAETDADGDPLTGEEKYVLHFPAGQLPPVDAFWSVTLYDSVTRLMIDNPIDRYSLGDRTAGLRYNANGSLTITIQHSSPGADEEANWLPAPAGRFYLNVRAYMPQQPLLDGSYRIPAVRKVSSFQA